MANKKQDYSVVITKQLPHDRYGARPDWGPEYTVETQKLNGEVQAELSYLNGDDSPPSVTAYKDGEPFICWNFLYDHRNREYYAEGTGCGVNHGFHKCRNLGDGDEREKAIETYNSLFAHKHIKWRIEKETPTP